MKYLIILIFLVGGCSTKNVAPEYKTPAFTTKWQLSLYKNGRYYLEKVYTPNSQNPKLPDSRSMGWYDFSNNNNCYIRHINCRILLTLYPKLNIHQDSQICIYELQKTTKQAPSFKILEIKGTVPFWIYTKEQTYLINSQLDIDKIHPEHLDRLQFFKNNSEISELIYDTAFNYQIQARMILKRFRPLIPKPKECIMSEDNRIIFQLKNELIILYQKETTDESVFRVYSE